MINWRDQVIVSMNMYQGILKKYLKNVLLLNITVPWHSLGSTWRLVATLSYFALMSSNGDWGTSLCSCWIRCFCILQQWEHRCLRTRPPATGKQVLCSPHMPRKFPTGHQLGDIVWALMSVVLSQCMIELHLDIASLFCIREVHFRNGKKTYQLLPVCWEPSVFFVGACYVTPVLNCCFKIK